MRMTFLNSQNHISMAASLQQFSILSWSGMWFPPTSWPFLDHSTPSTRVSCAKSRLAQTTCAPRAGFCRSCFRQPANWMGRDFISFYPNPKIDMLKHTTYIPPIIWFCHLKLFKSLFCTYRTPCRIGCSEFGQVEVASGNQFFSYQRSWRSNPQQCPGNLPNQWGQRS